MKLGGKVVVAALGAVACSLVIGLVNQLVVLRKQGTEMVFDAMRGVVLSGEEIRAQLSAMNQQQVFQKDALVEEARRATDLRSTRIYNTIPIVGAWTAIERVARKDGYSFRVVKHQARDPRNEPTAAEAAILARLKDGKLDELRLVENDRVVFARPIRLTADCLLCHGDPRTSPTADGKDVLGYAMENWKEGEIHGAFILSAPTTKLNAYTKAGFGKALWVVVPSMGGFGVILAFGLYFTTRRVILRPLHNVIGLIKSDCERETAIAAEIAESSMRLANAASEQAASIEETSATLEEIASMTKQNADHAESSQRLASQTKDAADAGARDMQEMVNAMEEIKSASDNIAAIIKTIDEIAFQTNILALNAAVEAARAGESGAGFAVVAEEVRALAHRSAAAARETAAKIESSITKSEQGVLVSEKVSKSLSEILERTRQLDSLVREIATGSKEQAQGIAQLNDAIAQLEKVTQDNAAVAEESASSAAELKNSSDDLDHAVTDLIDAVGTSNNTMDGSGDIRQVINKAIGAHGLWKSRLRKAIDTGHSDVPPDKACADNHCEFGKWLHSMDSAKRPPQWESIREQHARFHQEAGAILKLALNGQRKQAEERIAENSEFAAVSKRLTKEMIEWSGEARH